MPVLLARSSGPPYCFLNPFLYPFLCTFHYPFLNPFPYCFLVPCQQQHLPLTPVIPHFHPFRGLNHVKISSATTWHVCSSFPSTLHIASAKCKHLSDYKCSLATPTAPPPFTFEGRVVRRMWQWFQLLLQMSVCCGKLGIIRTTRWVWEEVIYNYESLFKNT